MKCFNCKCYCILMVSNFNPGTIWTSQIVVNLVEEDGVKSNYHKELKHSIKISGLDGLIF